MGREFDYSISLSAFSLMNYLSLTSIYFLYSAIITFSSFIATMFRVGEILKMDEYDDSFSENDKLPEDIRIKIENCNASWGSKSEIESDSKKNCDLSTLNNLNLMADKNEIIAIIGSVGSGKSSFLAAIMKELEIIAGSIKTNGSMAYVEQEPFITSGSIKDNILMGSEFNHKRFEQVVEV